MLLCGIVLLAATADTGQDFCSSKRGCDTCTAGNADAEVPYVCTWCYSSGNCTLAYEKENPSLSSWASGPGSCEDWTLEPTTCTCRPDKYTDCETCTSRSGCVWIKQATTTVTVKTKLPLLGETTAESVHSWGNVCWTGNGFTGPNVADRDVHGEYAHIKLASESSAWCWGQCGIEGPGFAALVMVLTLCLFIGVCAACWWIVRRIRRGPTTSRNVLNKA